jgi:hypothetical protein
MLKTVIFILVIIPSLSFGQIKFTSTKYNYTFVIPDGWQVKDKIYNPDVDAKIVDGKGNSFIVTVLTFPSEKDNISIELFESLTNAEMKEQLDGLYTNTQVIKRGRINIGFKPFYYTHFYVPFQNGLRLYHKMFFYIEGNKALCIDACSIETFISQTTPAFAIMADTFRISNLNLK